MFPRIALQSAIFASRKPHTKVAKAAAIHRSRLSKIVNGKLDPNKDEGAALAKVLKKPMSALFPGEKLRPRGRWRRG